MKFSPETAARIKRIARNALVFGSAAFITAVLQYLQGIDYGEHTPFIVAIIGISMKSVQAWIEPPPGMF